jgi:hypothetical protein
MIDDGKVIYPCSFAFNFSNSMLTLFFQHVLTSVIKKKIALLGDACSKPPITIRSHNLHGGDIRGAMGEIAPYHKRD